MFFFLWAITTDLDDTKLKVEKVWEWWIAWEWMAYGTNIGWQTKKLLFFPFLLVHPSIYCEIKFEYKATHLRFFQSIECYYAELGQCIVHNKNETYSISFRPTFMHLIFYFVCCALWFHWDSRGENLENDAYKYNI